MEPWEPIAREAIREALARYAHLVDRGRLDDAAALFTEDAVLEAGDEAPARGREAIRALFAGAGTRLAANGRARIRHHVSSVTIAFDDAWTATAESYFLALVERGPDHWGRYRDRLVLRDGRWLFAHRRVRVDGRAP
jgi:ketosteroid isomerase-like protein